VREVGSSTLVVIAVVVLVAGCSRAPDAKDAQADLDESRSSVNVEVRDAARVLSGGDWRVSGLGGSFSTCSGTAGMGSASVIYSAGGDVKGGAGTQAERIRAASQMLEDAGWKLVDQGETRAAGEYSRLTRHGFELAIDRDQLEGSQDFGFGANGDCIGVTDQQYSDLPDDGQIVP
jgi:hypothetical protein